MLETIKNKVVSIPIWFDLKKHRIQILFYILKFQFLYGSI